MDRFVVAREPDRLVSSGGKPVKGIERRSNRPEQSLAMPKRKLRNYLLDRRFQLKYTSMVVGVTLVVASLLGALAYHESKGQTEALQIQLMVQQDLDPQVSASLESFGRERDAHMLLAILAGIFVMTLALGMTGIVVTHKMVGPAYRIRQLLATVAAGRLRVDGHLRRGDELQDVFAAFNTMVENLRARQTEEIAGLDAAIARAERAGVAEDVVKPFRELRARMQDQLYLSISSPRASTGSP